MDSPDRTESESEDPFSPDAGLPSPAIINDEDMFISNTPFNATPGPKRTPLFSDFTEDSFGIRSPQDDLMSDDSPQAGFYMSNVNVFTPSSRNRNQQDSTSNEFGSFGIDKKPEELVEADIFSDDDESFSDDLEAEEQLELVLSSGESEEEDFAFLLWKTRLNNITNKELLGNYKHIAQHRASLLSNQVDRTSKFGNLDMNEKATTEKENLEQEEFTWDLLLSLEKGRQMNPNSEWKVHSYERNACILNWLENIAKSNAKLNNKETVATDVSPYDNICETTKQSSSDSSQEGFMKLLWTCVRAGDMEAAESLCSNCNQFWRFGSLDGSDFTSSGGIDMSNRWTGNPHRNLWKYCCWQLSSQASFSEYERALYASRCGNLLQMFKVCNNWQDYLWACFRVLIDSNDDIQLKLNPPESYVQPDTILNEPELPLGQGASCCSIEQIFTQLQNNNIITDDKYELIQSWIIKQDFHQIFTQIAYWSKVGEASPLLLRLGTHMLLYYRSKGEFVPVQEGDSIIRDYIAYLVSQFNNYIPELEVDAKLNEDSFRMKKARAIALYTAQLSSKEEQIETFARFLSQMEHATEDEKEVFWSYACDACLDRESITCRVYEISTESSKTKDITQKKLSALQWLCLDAEQRDKALIRANELLGEFLFVNDYTTCNALVQNVLPEDTFSIVVNHKLHSNEVRNACREYFCLDLYLSCQNLYNDWKSGAVQGSSMAIGDIAMAVTKDAHEKKQMALAQRFVTLAQMLLKFPPSELSEEFFVAKYQPILHNIQRSGWLIDEYETENISRSSYLQQMRCHCLPKVVLELEEILSDCGEYIEVVRIADWVTDQRWQIYSSFNKEELRELLRRIRTASIRILATSKDPLGLKLE